MKKSFLSCNDTIAAIATPLFPGAIGVIKISGKDALSIVHRVFLPKRRKDIRKAQTYTLHYGWIVSINGQKRRKDSREKIDEVLIAIMRRPHSYTREDVVEIYSHSSILVTSKILKLIVSCGARLAEAGEFTRRAFLSGRIDLIQAEAVMDVVQAKTDQALQTSVLQLQGMLSGKMRALSQKVEMIYAALEAAVSFPEESRAPERVRFAQDIRKTKTEIEQLLAGCEQGRILREGVKCVICGRANVGKSSLFNSFLGENKAIVTHIAGTTRDLVEASLVLGGIPFFISDTAGIAPARDCIEEEAQRKSEEAIAAADVILFVLDNAVPLHAREKALLRSLAGRRSIIVVNKIDLPGKLEQAELREFSTMVRRISVLENNGIERLKQSLVCLFSQKSRGHHPLYISNIRHIILLERILQHLTKASGYLQDGQSLDFLLVPLQEAWNDFGEITGSAYSQDILDSIFKRFCIGK